MASAALSRRVERVVGYLPLSELSADRRRECHEALLEADAFDDGRLAVAAQARWHRRLAASGRRESGGPGEGSRGGSPSRTRCRRTRLQRRRAWWEPLVGAP